MKCHFPASWIEPESTEGHKRAAPRPRHGVGCPGHQAGAGAAELLFHTPPVLRDLFLVILNLLLFSTLPLLFLTDEMSQVWLCS